MTHSGHSSGGAVYIDFIVQLQRTPEFGPRLPVRARTTAEAINRCPIVERGS